MYAIPERIDSIRTLYSANSENVLNTTLFKTMYNGPRKLIICSFKESVLLYQNISSDQSAAVSNSGGKRIIIPNNTITITIIFNTLISFVFVIII